MIDTNALNKFLDEANSRIKSDVGLQEGTTWNATSASVESKTRQLCDFTVQSVDHSITFSIESRGYVKDESAFFLVARLGRCDEEYVSRGYFTAFGGHHTDFKMSHDEPRGFSIQQGVLIEMLNIVERMIVLCKFISAIGFLSELMDELKGMKVKAVVVKSDDDAIGEISDIPEFADASVEPVESQSIGKLSIKGERMSEDEIKERVNNICNPEPVEGTIGETFAKNVGNKSEKPEKDNSIDDDMKSMQEYVIQKESFWTRLWKRIKAMFGIVSDSEALENLFDNNFNGKEDK